MTHFISEELATRIEKLMFIASEIFKAFFFMGGNSTEISTK